MSDKQTVANQKAFRSGQEAWRENKGVDRDNPYPTVSQYHHFWRQGWEQEQELQDK